MHQDNCRIPHGRQLPTLLRQWTLMVTNPDSFGATLVAQGFVLIPELISRAKVEVLRQAFSATPADSGTQHVEIEPTVPGFDAWAALSENDTLIQFTSLLLDEPVFRAHGRNPLCLLYTSPSPRDRTRSRMPSSA